jgi:cyclopropane-fatty-acyl-phospholipid synthase
MLPVAGCQLECSNFLTWLCSGLDLIDWRFSLVGITCAQETVRCILGVGPGWKPADRSALQASKYPRCSFRAVSNSSTQRVYILQQAAERGLNNVTATTADMNTFVADTQYDRVLSVEMFEHMKNYGV